MKRKGLVVLALLVVASLMAAMGTGAINVFSANRSSAMTIVNDSDALIGISGDGVYATETNKGLKIDFNNGDFDGKGLNPQAKSEFYEVFTVTNQSPKTVYVWLEAEGWSSQHNGGLQYRINDYNGEVTNVNAWYGNTQPNGKNLLDSTGMNFVNGVGKNAYIKLDSGEYFNVNIYVKTTLSNGYGDANTPYSDWSHKVIVKANENAPTRP